MTLISMAKISAQIGSNRRTSKTSPAAQVVDRGRAISRTRSLAILAYMQAHAAIPIYLAPSPPGNNRSLKGICPRGNNKVVIIIFHVDDKCLFLMLELY
jgi:hypothetical protein